VVHLGEKEGGNVEKKGREGAAGFRRGENQIRMLKNTAIVNSNRAKKSVAARDRVGLINEKKKESNRTRNNGLE